MDQKSLFQSPCTLEEKRQTKHVCEHHPQPPKEGLKLTNLLPRKHYQSSGGKKVGVSLDISDMIF